MGATVAMDDGGHRETFHQDNILKRLPHDLIGSPRSMKMLEGPALSRPRSRRSATLH